MRFAPALLLALSLLAAGVAAPVVAQTAVAGGARLSPSRPDAGALGLRGAGALTPATEDAPPAEDAPDLGLRPLGSGLGPPPLASLPPPPDARQCRLQCAQTYYFCLADQASDECPQYWGQCRLGCEPRGGVGG